MSAAALHVATRMPRPNGSFSTSCTPLPPRLNPLGLRLKVLRSKSGQHVLFVIAHAFHGRGVPLDLKVVAVEDPYPCRRNQFEEMVPSLRLAKYTLPGCSERRTSRSFLHSRSLRSFASFLSSSPYNLLGLPSLSCTSKNLHPPLGTRCKARNLPARFAASRH